MSTRSFYMLLLAAIALLLWQMPNIKKLSSYNIKWLFIYIMYSAIFIMSFPSDFGFSDSDYIEENVANILAMLIIAPLLCYVFLPTLLKLIGNWLIVKCIDKIIDKIYQNIKSLC